MLRLLVHVEGQTEETFVNEILALHLNNSGDSSISARLMGSARQCTRRGGIRKWPTVLQDIVRHLREDECCFATIMLDYYGLPMTGNGAQPGRAESSSSQFAMKAQIVEDHISKYVQSKIGKDLYKNRFIPYLMMHEFEAPLFSDCKKFCNGIGKPELTEKFQKIRSQFENPEEIDESPNQAPSKRIQALVENYEKPLLGTLAVSNIGLGQILKQCPNFSKWMDKLESL